MLWVVQRQLTSKNAVVRRKAVARFVAEPNPRAFDSLLPRIADEDPEVRRLAVAALGKLPEPEVAEALLPGLLDPEPEVVQATLVALKKREPDQLIPKVIPLLRHPESVVRTHAAQFLDQAKWHPENRSDESWFLVAVHQFGRAAELGATAFPALELALASVPPRFGIAVVKALGKINDPRTLALLKKTLGADDPGVCIAAVESICGTVGEKSTSLILPVLKHANGQVRAAAAECLGQVRAQEAAGPLRELLEDPVWEVRKHAAEALGRLADPGSIEKLGRLLEDTDDDVREAAVMALAGIGDRRGIGSLVLALKDNSSGVRRLAAASLSRIDTHWSTSPEAHAALEILKSSPEDLDSSRRYLVNEVLSSFGLGKAEMPLSFAGLEKEAAPGSRKKLAVGLLLTLICDPDGELRQAAALALGKFADEQSRPALLRAQSDPNPAVRHTATAALASLR